MKKALVLSGDGINAEAESALACRMAGFNTEIRHINDLIAEDVNQDRLTADYSLLFLPGGFSFGDELGSGRVLALKLKHRLRWDLHQYAKRGGLVLGVCNGFQALIRLGIFGSDVAIASNASGKFQNRWTGIRVARSVRSAWMARDKKSNLHPEGMLALPIRHGEGRLIFTGKAATVQRQVALRYSEDVNGSFDQIAGLTDASGRILGLMPHPEAAIRSTQRPDWNGPEQEGAGLEFFRNAFKEANRQ